MTTRMSDLVMSKDKYGDDGEGEHKDQGDAEKNHKHLTIMDCFLANYGFFWCQLWIFLAISTQINL